MRVDEKIKSIVSQMQGLNFEFNDWTRANVTLDFKNLPVCLYLLPVSGILFNKNGNMRDCPNALIAFLDLAEFDYDGATNEPTVERMKGYARDFIHRVNNSRLFSPLPENVNYSVVYDKLDANVTGVVLSVRLEELHGDCINSNELYMPNDSN